MKEIEEREWKQTQKEESSEIIQSMLKEGKLKLDDC